MANNVGVSVAQSFPLKPNSRYRPRKTLFHSQPFLPLLPGERKRLEREDDDPDDQMAVGADNIA